MPDDQLRTDEDVEEILRLAVQQNTVDSADLRSRLTLSAAEMGISEEQLKRAETQYFQEKEVAVLRAEKLAVEAEEKSRTRKRRIARFLSVTGVAAAVIGLVVLFNTQNLGYGGFFLFLAFPAFFAKNMGNDRRDAESESD